MRRRGDDHVSALGGEIGNDMLTCQFGICRALKGNLFYEVRKAISAMDAMLR